MTEYFSSEPQFLFEEAQERTTPAFTNERWIEMVLINPLSIVPKVSTTSTYRENFSDRELTALYADWQTRDSEIGYDIVERRKRELQSGIELYKQALDRRNRSLAMARARLQTIQRINSNEPDKKLHYPTSTIDELQKEITATETELAYLRRYMSSMAALNGVIQMLNASGRSDMVERYYRLIGQAWRGEMKLRAFQARFQITLPKEDPNNPISGQIITNTTVESPFGREVVVSDLTLSYLHHQLSIIGLLSEKTRLLFDPAEQAAQLSGEWPAAMVLLSAIVELFYFCSFEMTISSHARLVEKQGVGKIWNFNASANEWQPFTEQPIEQMRRQSTSTALLLIEYPLFLRCSNQTELSKACYSALTRIDSDMLAQIYGPYQFTGLARMDYRTDGRNFRTQSAIALTGEVLAHVVAQSEQLKGYFYRSGSPLETVLAMANLDPKAFGLDGKDYLARPVALKLLGDFWKRMGKNRPVGLLGDIYAKGIYAGLASIGESAPERSSLVSIHLTNVLGRSLFGDGEGKGMTDLLTVLMLADQIRLMELLELSWAYAEAVLNDLRTVASLQEIGELIRLGGTFAQHEVEIAKRFNQKWISATQPLWTILRGSAPHAWGFWTKMAEGYSIAQLLAAYEPAQALGYFLMPLADITRLMLLFETSSPVLSEKLKTDSETAVRSLLSGFERFKSWQAPLGNVIEEALGYYFDLTIQHDAWVSFTESLKSHLRLLDTDLQSRQAPEAIITMLSTVLVRLEANHPTPQLMQYDSPPEVVVSSQTKLPFCDFADSDCQFLQHLSRNLLGEKILSQAIVLKTISLWRNSDLRESLRNISYFANILSGLILDETLRAMLISSPMCVQACGQILQGLKENSSDLSDQVINDILNILRNHRQAQQKVESVLAIPNFPFDEDRQHLSELSVKTDGEKVEMMLVAVFSTPCLVIVTRDSGTVGTLSKLEAELSHRLQARLAEFELEIMPLGGISLSASEAGLSLSSSSLEVDPIFYESSKQASARMLWSFASNKMALASKILQEELQDSMIALKL